MSVDKKRECDRLAPFMRIFASRQEKLGFLLEQVNIQKVVVESFWADIFSKIETVEEKIAFLSIITIDQHKILFRGKRWKDMVKDLVKIETFYQSIGGIIGYHRKVLELMQLEGKKEEISSKYLSPSGFDIRLKSKAVSCATLAGIYAMSRMGEIYPIGGLGDRLNLRGENDEPLPTASLPFCGRSLLEGLVRDLEAREFLYYKLFKKQIITPIALMTSHEKENEQHIRALCKTKKWFSRGEENFCIFSQISVPVITAEGKWSMRNQEELNCQPGGHGALWLSAEENEVYSWFKGHLRDAVLIRQINNPIAGIDHGLLALIGLGQMEDKAFGFASCKRVPHAAEGALTLLEKRDGLKAIVNIEYTNFERFGIEEAVDDEGNSLFPTNTNILYADLEKLKSYIRKNPLPGLILNMKSAVPFLSEEGIFSEVKGGRLESMMQNISDNLESVDIATLPSFMTYNERLKTISVTKRSVEANKSLLETPQSAFYDLMHNGREVLKLCQFDIDLCKTEEMLFLYHPSLGPLYEVIGQKIRRGTIVKGSYMELEIAEVLVQNLHLDGSLIITADTILGRVEKGRRHYNEWNGKCELRNVRVINSGIDRSKPNIYWKNEIAHLEKLHICIQGSGEFLAEDITICGNLEVVVPDKERWVAFERGDGTIAFHKKKIEAPTWYWDYTVLEDEIIVSQSISHKPVSQGKRPQPRPPMESLTV